MLLFHAANNAGLLDRKYIWINRNQTLIRRLTKIDFIRFEKKNGTKRDNWFKVKYIFISKYSNHTKIEYRNGRALVLICLFDSDICCDTMTSLENTNIPCPEPVYTGWSSVHWNSTGIPLVDPVYTGIPLDDPANTCRVHCNTTEKI